MPDIRDELLRRCPHEPTITDECSGLVVPNIRYEDWIDGAVAGCVALVAAVTEQEGRA